MYALTKSSHLLLELKRLFSAGDCLKTNLNSDLIKQLFLMLPQLHMLSVKICQLFFTITTRKKLPCSC